MTPVDVPTPFPARPPRVVLRCRLTVHGLMYSAFESVPRNVYENDEHFRDFAKASLWRSLGEAIVAEHRPPVTVDEPPASAAQRSTTPVEKTAEPRAAAIAACIPYCMDDDPRGELARQVLTALGTALDGPTNTETPQEQ